MTNGGRLGNNNGSVTGCKRISTTSAVSFFQRGDEHLSSRKVELSDPAASVGNRAPAVLRRSERTRFIVCE